MNNEFSWSAAREARIDRAIDRAVREMVQIDPPPGLRRRVLSRLNESTERPGYPSPRYVMAAIAVVVLLVSVSLVQDRVDPPAPPKAPDIATMGRAPSIRGEGYIPAQPSMPPVTREPIRMPRVTNVFGNRPGEVSAATIDAPTGIIAATPLTIVPLSARPIVIAPLVLPRLPKSGQ
jgi:hypothetical protein